MHLAAFPDAFFGSSCNFGGESSLAELVLETGESEVVSGNAVWELSSCSVIDAAEFDFLFGITCEELMVMQSGIMT